MKRIFVLVFLLLVLAFPDQSLGSSATAVAETEVEAGQNTQVYQSVETTVNGQTVKKESTQPGKLELEMRKVGDEEATVSFSQEPATSTSDVESATPSPTAEVEENAPQQSQPKPMLQRFVDFLKQTLGNFFGIFKSA